MAVAGYKAVFQINNSTYTTVGNVKSVDLTIGTDIYDISALTGSVWKTKLPGMADFQIKIAGYFDLTDAQQALLQTDMITSPGTAVAFKLLPTGVGGQAFGGSGFLKSQGLKIDVKSEQQISWDIEGSGPLTFS